MYPKGSFDWINIKKDFGDFVVTLGLRNFHMWGEVKWTFLKNYSIIFCEILWIYPNASDFVHSKVLDWFKIKLENFQRGDEVKWFFSKTTR